MIGDPEVRSASAFNTRTTEQVSLADRLRRFSSWSIATRAIAWILRRICKNKSNSLTSATEQEHAEQFWSRWRREYLEVGDVVKMKEDETHRNEWRLARVTETTTDKDGLVRRVKICLGERKLGKRGERLHKMSEVERPIQKLVLLLEAN